MVILLTGFDRADPIVSLLVAALMLRSAVALLGAAGRVILEAAPAGLDPPEIGRALAAVPERRRGPRPARLGGRLGLPGALGARARQAATPTATRSRRSLEQLLRERFGLTHSTLQVDHAGEDELIELQPPRSA